MFWDFLRCNFVKFQVLGEKEYLISKLFDAFKFHEDEASLIKTGKQMATLKKEDIADILFEVDKKIGAAFDCKNDIEKIYGLTKFWKTIKDCDIRVNDAFMSFICAGFHIFDRFNRAMPELLSLVRESNVNFINEEIVGEIYSSRFENKRLWFYTVELLKNWDETTTKQFIDKIALHSPYNQPNDIEAETLKKMGYFQCWKKRIFDEKKINHYSDGTSYIGDYYNRSNVCLVLDNIEWDESVFWGIEQVLNWDKYIHGRINSAHDYYRFTEFQSELISGTQYRDKIKECIQKYRSVDEATYPYVRYFDWADNSVS